MAFSDADRDAQLPQGNGFQGEGPAAELLVSRLFEQLSAAVDGLRGEMKSLRAENAELRLSQRAEHFGALRKRALRPEAQPDDPIVDLDSYNAGVCPGTWSTSRSDILKTNSESHEKQIVATSGDLIVSLDEVCMEPTNGTAWDTMDGPETSQSTCRNVGIIHEVSEVWQRQNSAISRRMTGLEPPLPSEVSHKHSVVLVEQYEGLFKRMISFPGSPHRLGWDIFGFILIVYDLIILPLRVFEPPENWFSYGLDWVVLMYWTANVFMSLSVGYVEKGITVMDPRKILINYLKTWFIIDIGVLAPDWYLTVQSTYLHHSSDSEAGEATKLLRMLRLAKCLRLLRAARLKKILQQLTDRVDSEYTGIMINILKMFALLFLVNHYLAAMWYVVGTLDNETTWIKDSKTDKLDWAGQYLLCFHWSITQFTPASKVPVQPTNLVERVYAISVVLFALVGFSYIVGSITGSLTQLRAMAEDADRQFYEVRRYLRQHEVSSVLGARIQRFLEHAYAKSKARTNWEGIRIFSLLSESLQSELRVEIALPLLRVHPLFLRLSLEYMPTLQRIVARVGRRILANGEVLFFPGEQATHMYFLDAGRVEYSKPSRGGSSTLTESVERKDAWIAEPVLWTSSWIHVGRPTAKKESDLLSFSPKDFADTVTLSPSATLVVSTYARCFVTWLNDAIPQELSDLFHTEDVEGILDDFLPTIENVSLISKAMSTTKSRSGNIAPYLSM